MEHQCLGAECRTVLMIPCPSQQKQHAEIERLLADIERWNATIAVAVTKAEQMDAVIRAARNLVERRDEGYATLVSYLIRLHEAVATFDANPTPLPVALGLHEAPRPGTIEFDMEYP